ncbi:AzlD domain-containing protein [Victivallis sp.]|uniref:AzlD domain-containing protein n=1 Tax=Victivallis sp. TaxID=2049020 RepID=UPI003A922BD7
MTGSAHVFWMIAVMATVTFLIRAFPFVLFGQSQKPPDMVEHFHFSKNSPGET